MVHHDLDRAAGREVGEADDVDGVVGLDPLVVVGVGERQGEHALLLQVRLVDAGERPHDHRPAVHVPRLHRRVLTGRAFAVVLVADRHPRDAGVLVALGEIGQRRRSSRRATSTPVPGAVEGERVVHAR